MKKDGLTGTHSYLYGLVFFCLMKFLTEILPHNIYYVWRKVLNAITIWMNAMLTADKQNNFWWRNKNEKRFLFAMQWSKFEGKIVLPSNFDHCIAEEKIAWNFVIFLKTNATVFLFFMTKHNDVGFRLTGGFMLFMTIQLASLIWITLSDIKKCSRVDCMYFIQHASKPR